ncbi:hypothetical protein UXO11_22300 [Enterobacter wuhouensis]|uniref:hypothetical protein n=1 Tax=Enterobacter wuhouensis TaxID=2529381 RepID=UPI002FD1C22C
MKKNIKNIIYYINVKMKCTRALTILLLMVSLWPYLTYAVSWGSVSEVEVKSNDMVWGTFSWGWPAETNNDVICMDSRGCIVTVGPWDPRGGPPAGGINAPSGVSQKVSVPFGTTTSDAFKAWIDEYGNGGSYTQAMWFTGMDLSQTCFGFQSFPGQDSTIRITGTLLPGTVCGKVPPPLMKCDLSVPLEIDLGTVALHSVNVQGNVSGNVTCNMPATVLMLIPTSPLLGSNEVVIQVNGETLGVSPVIVGQGKEYLPIDISAHVKGSLDTPGVHQGNFVLVMMYQ